MFRATILKVKIGTIPVKDFKMAQETKAAIQAELLKADPYSYTFVQYHYIILDFRYNYLP